MEKVLDNFEDVVSGVPKSSPLDTINNELQKQLSGRLTNEQLEILPDIIMSLSGDLATYVATKLDNIAYKADRKSVV